MELRQRVTRRRVAIFAAAIATVAFAAPPAMAEGAPALITPYTCEEVGGLGVFSVEGGIRYCTTATQQLVVEQVIPGTTQYDVPGPEIGTVWEYTGSWIVFTNYVRTTIESQVGANPIETTTTMVPIESGQGGSCTRILRDAFLGIILLVEVEERPEAECIEVGLFPFLPLN